MKERKDAGVKWKRGKGIQYARTRKLAVPREKNLRFVGGGV